MPSTQANAGLKPRSAPTASEIEAANNSDRVVKVLSFGLFLFSTTFFTAVTFISYTNPGYFDRLLIQKMAEVEIDPIAVGSTAKASSEEAAPVEAIPVAKLVRPRELKPQDFSIVMVFGDEAHLASPGELWRVQVGSTVPGLGEILEIEPGENGGTVKAEKATLMGMPQQ